MIPDAEKVVGDYLRANADMVALGARVVGETPADTDSAPWVKVSQLDDQAVGGARADHLIEFMLQLDCYASKAGTDGSQQKEASLLSRTVRAALKAMPGTHADAVVTGVLFLSNPRIPDTDYEPARQRYARTVIVWMHPTPS